MITTLATSQNNNNKKTLNPSSRDFVAKISAAKYDFNLYKGFFIGKMAPNCQILSIIFQILRF